jgi:hypothetical protein
VDQRSPGVLTPGIFHLVTYLFTGSVYNRHVSSCGILAVIRGHSMDLVIAVLLGNLMQYGTILINSVFSIAESFFKRMNV